MIEIKDSYISFNLNGTFHHYIDNSGIPFIMQYQIKDSDNQPYPLAFSQLPPDNSDPAYLELQGTIIHNFKWSEYPRKYLEITHLKLVFSQPDTYDYIIQFAQPTIAIKIYGISVNNYPLDPTNPGNNVWQMDIDVSNADGNAPFELDVVDMLRFGVDGKYVGFAISIDADYKIISDRFYNEGNWLLLLPLVKFKIGGE